MERIHKGYCEGCPYDYGKPATEMALNLGCLPTPREIDNLCEGKRAWACHDQPQKVCCGFSASSPDKTRLPLHLERGVHF